MAANTHWILTEQGRVTAILDDEGQPWVFISLSIMTSDVTVDIDYARWLARALEAKADKAEAMAREAAKEAAEP